MSKERILDQCNCCCCNCQCNSNSNNQSKNQNGESSGNTNDNDPNDSDKKDNHNSNNNNNSDKKDNSDQHNVPGNNPGNSGGNTKENESTKNKKIIRLKNSEFGLSLSLFFFSIIFFGLLFCFISKYMLGFAGLYFTCHFIGLSIPLAIYFILDIALISIRISCNESYKLLFGTDKFIKQNNGLIILNFLQLFFLLLIYLFLVLIIFITYEKICQIFAEFLTFLCFCFYCECSCDKVTQFCKDICEKEYNNNNTINIPEKKINDSKIRNEINEVISSEERVIRESNDDDNIDNEPKFINKELNPTVPKSDNNGSRKINPEGLDSEMYKPNCLLGQKILIVMTHYSSSINIEKLYENGKNRTVREAVEHFGIDIVSVNNYEDAINELTKNEEGNCPYYACWLINSYGEVSGNIKDFLNILLTFWKNGGAVVLFADNEPFNKETNRFLSMINAGFTMDGDYIGEKIIYGDETGKLCSPGLFNRKKEYYTLGNIKRQTLSHNLHEIYEGITISSVTKDGKRRMDVKNDDIKPFIPFARDSEGGKLL